MLKYIPYAIAALLALAATIQGINALYKHVYKSGVESCEIALKDNQIEQLSKAAEHIVNEQAKLEIIEQTISGDSDKSKVNNPVLLRVIKRVSDDCSGKTNC